MTAAENSLKPGMVVSRAIASRKGSRRSPNSLVDLGDGRIERIDLGEVIAQQEALVRGQPTAQGFDNLGAGGPDLGSDLAGKPLGVGLAGSPEPRGELGRSHP